MDVRTVLPLVSRDAIASTPFDEFAPTGGDVVDSDWVPVSARMDVAENYYLAHRQGCLEGVVDAVMAPRKALLRIEPGYGSIPADRVYERLWVFRGVYRGISQRKRYSPSVGL